MTDPCPSLPVLPEADWMALAVALVRVGAPPVMVGRARYGVYAANPARLIADAEAFGLDVAAARRAAAAVAEPGGGE